MTTPSCDRAALVEAMFDGRLGPPELASTERHVKTCASCAELLRDLTSLQEMLRSTSTVLAPLEHQRARLSLLRETAKPVAAKRRSTALLAAAFATLPLVVWAANSSLTALRRREPPPALEATVEPVTAAPKAVQAPVEPPAPVPLSSTVAEGTPLSAPPAVSHRPVRAKDVGATSARVHPLPVKTSASAASSTEVSHASRDFADAVNALSSGDFGASAGKLRRFVAAYPTDARVEEAIYLEAIALERAGRDADARAAALRYLALYPNGAHDAHARRIAASR